MNLEDASRRATALLREHLGPDADERFTITSAELHDNGWLFFYNTAAFVRSRSLSDLLGGNLPILVKPDGDAEFVSYDSPKLPNRPDTR